MRGHWFWQLVALVVLLAGGYYVLHLMFGALDAVALGVLVAVWAWRHSSVFAPGETLSGVHWFFWLVRFVVEALVLVALAHYVWPLVVPGGLPALVAAVFASLVVWHFADHLWDLVRMPHGHAVAAHAH